MVVAIGESRRKNASATQSFSRHLPIPERIVDHALLNRSNCRHWSSTSRGENMATECRHIEPLGLFSGQPTPRLYHAVIEAIRVRLYSRQTGKAYVNWIRRYILFHGPHHPRELSELDTNRFLTHLAVATICTTQRFRGHCVR